MQNEEIIAIRKEIAALRAEVVDVREALKLESTNNTQHFRSVYRYIADIHDYLMPVVHKVFPGYTAAKKQIDKFMESYGASDAPRKSR
jgi:hypothetical protein